MDFIRLENLENNSGFYLRELLLSQDFLCFVTNKVYGSPLLRSLHQCNESLLVNYLRVGTGIANSSVL